MEGASGGLGGVIDSLGSVASNASSVLPVVGAILNLATSNGEISPSAGLGLLKLAASGATALGSALAGTAAGAATGAATGAAAGSFGAGLAAAGSAVSAALGPVTLGAALLVPFIQGMVAIENHRTQAQIDSSMFSELTKPFFAQFTDRQGNPLGQVRGSEGMGRDFGGSQIRFDKKTGMIGTSGNVALKKRTPERLARGDEIRSYVPKVHPDDTETLERYFKPAGALAALMQSENAVRFAFNVVDKLRRVDVHGDSSKSGQYYKDLLREKGWEGIEEELIHTPKVDAETEREVWKGLLGGTLPRAMNALNQSMLHLQFANPSRPVHFLESVFPDRVAGAFGSRSGGLTDKKAVKEARRPLNKENALIPPETQLDMYQISMEGILDVWNPNNKDQNKSIALAMRNDIAPAVLNQYESFMAIPTKKERKKALKQMNQDWKKFQKTINPIFATGIT